MLWLARANIPEENRTPSNHNEAAVFGDYHERVLFNIKTNSVSIYWLKDKISIKLKKGKMRVNTLTSETFDLNW